MSLIAIGWTDYKFNGSILVSNSASVINPFIESKAMNTAQRNIIRWACYLLATPMTLGFLFLVIVGEVALGSEVIAFLCSPMIFITLVLTGKMIWAGRQALPASSS